MTLPDWPSAKKAPVLKPTLPLFSLRRASVESERSPCASDCSTSSALSGCNHSELSPLASVRSPFSNASALSKLAVKYDMLCGNSGLVASGAFGQVWRANCRGCGGRVAVKTTEKPAYASNDDHDEGTMLKDCQGCPNVVRVLDVFEDWDQTAIVMDFCSALDLQRWDMTKLTDLNKREIVKSLLETLSAIHGRGIAHGDIRLENVLVGYREEVGGEKTDNCGCSCPNDRKRCSTSATDSLVGSVECCSAASSFDSVKTTVIDFGSAVRNASDSARAVDVAAIGWIMCEVLLGERIARGSALSSDLLFSISGDKLSADAVDLIHLLSCCEYNPSTVTRALSHRWLTPLAE